MVKGVLTISDRVNNDEQRHCHHSSFGCHIALSDVALVMLLMVVMGMGNRCEWQPLVMVMGRWVGVVKDGGGGGFRRKQLFVDAQINHRQKPMINLGIGECK